MLRPNNMYNVIACCMQVVWNGVGCWVIHCGFLLDIERWPTVIVDWECKIGVDAHGLQWLHLQSPSCEPLRCLKLKESKHQPPILLSRFLPG